MFPVNNDNHDVDVVPFAEVLPFADIDIPSEIHIDHQKFETSGHNDKARIFKRVKRKRNLDNSNDRFRNACSIFSYVYFEKAKEENTLITFLSYTGPSNTLHLGKSLYLPQPIVNTADNSECCFQHFLQDYDKTTAILMSSSDALAFQIYLRFGVFYVTKLNATLCESIPLREFTALRHKGKNLKTAFYACKGITSPKRLLSTLTKLDYHRTSSNAYSYDVQLYGIKSDMQIILHFLYDEQFCCRSVFARGLHPHNFDFIRNKTFSIFRSTDDSYADIFDFRIQLAQGKHLSKTDPIVLNGLRGVPIDQVLFIDAKTHLLHVSPKLKQFVKYLKCTRASSYQNNSDQFVIHIGTYEEFELNSQGQLELSMRSSNTMTIEYLDLKTIPSGKTLYDIGMWFSTLCQASVDLPPTTTEKITNKSCKWFPSIFSWGNKYNQSMKQMNVSQLTTYKKQPCMEVRSVNN